jgi:hypothetical protein
VTGDGFSKQMTFAGIVLGVLISVLISCDYFDPLNPYNIQPHTPVTWQVHLGGAGEDVARSVQQTSDGGYILTGYTNSYSAGGDYDLWLVKTDISGGVEWSKTFGGTGDDFGYSGQQTPDGGYILLGSTKSFGAGEADVYLIKTNDKGEQQWYKTFGGSLDDCGYSVQCTSDGGFIIVGNTCSFGTSDCDVYLIKADGFGAMEWFKNFGESFEDQGFCVRPTADGGFVIAGLSHGLSSDDDMYFIKTDANGDREWYKIIGGTDLDGGTGVQQTSDGGYILCGYTDSYGALDWNAWLIKTDSNGLRQWDRTFGEDGWDQLNAVQQTSDGGYVMAGMSRSYGPWGEVWLIKIDASSKLEWSRLFSGQGDDWGLGVQQTADGGYILAGKTSSFGDGDMDAYLIYYKP